MLKHKKTFIRSISSLSRQNSNSQSLPLNGQLKDALLKMATLGLELDFWSYDSVLNVCINRRAYREGQRVHAHMIKTRVHAHMIKTRYLIPVYLNTRLVIFYVKCDALDDARQVFEEMPERSIVSWTAMVSGYSKKGLHLEALGLFVRMMATGKLNHIV